MAGTGFGTARRRLSVMVAGTVCALLVMPPAAAGAPPDRLEPPAAGEGRPLADPTDPPPPAGYLAQPSPSITLAGIAFPRQELEELVGADRYATAVATSRAGWPGGAAAAVLATGEDYHDPLVASTLAGTVGGPLLLTPTDRLDARTRAELVRLAPEVVYVVGMLGTAVEADVNAAGPATERVSAANVLETAFAVAERAVELGAESSTVLVASGAGFADALSASALAAGLRLPLLLTGPTGLRHWLGARIHELGATRTLVVGGTAALPEDAVAGLPGLERLAGPDRSATATVVADRARALGLSGRPVVVGGENFPDGLSGGAFAGIARRAPVLVTLRRELSPVLAGWLARTGTAAVTVVGGRAAVGPTAVCQLRSGDTRSWLCAEEQLALQGYNAGAVDGAADHQTVWAIFAFQKVAGLAVDGGFGEAGWQALLAAPRPAVRRPDLPPDHIEIDIARQLILVVRGGVVAHALHTSTGKASTPTVRGTFSVYEKRNYRQANHMYRAVFFYRGYALHGYPEIPLYPASHGCARTYDGDMDFLWPMLSMGERVATY